MPAVKYFIQMNSDNELQGREVGLDTIIKQGKEMVQNGKTGILCADLDEWKVKLNELIEQIKCDFITKE